MNNPIESLNLQKIKEVDIMSLNEGDEIFVFDVSNADRIIKGIYCFERVLTHTYCVVVGLNGGNKYLVSSDSMYRKKERKKPLKMKDFI